MYTSGISRHRGADAPAALIAEPVEELPPRLAVGGGSCLYVDGICEELPAGSPRAFLRVGDSEHALLGSGVPRPGLRGQGGYWWSLVEFAPISEPAEVEVELCLRLEAGGMRTASLGTIELLPDLVPTAGEGSGIEAAAARLDPADQPIAIAMASYEPERESFRVQIDSIREQSRGNWLCLISDDCSRPETRAMMREVLDGDERFVLIENERRLGFYGNFERVLELVPEQVDLIALSDQDDRWEADKLASLADGLGPGQLLIYSDSRIVDRSGNVLFDTYWSLRPNNFTDFGSIMVANTVTGAASMIRRELLDLALPFPPKLGNAFHDHWLAQVALAAGPISYVDRPLYDYVQHDDAAIGFLVANGHKRYSGSLLDRIGSLLGRFRDRGFRPGLAGPYFNVYCRVAQAARMISLRLGPRLEGSRTEVIAALAEPGAARRWTLGRALAERGRTTATLGRERLLFAGLVWIAMRQQVAARMLRESRR